MTLQEAIKEYAPANYTDHQTEVLCNSDYIRKSANLVNQALHNGCDVLQLPDGTIVISEFKPVTYVYAWDQDKNRLTRAQRNNRRARRKMMENYDASEEETPRFTQELEEMA